MKLSMPKAYRPSVRPLRPQHVVGNPDLLTTGRLMRHSTTTVGLPGAQCELESAEVTITGVDGPVATALTCGNGVPIHTVCVR